MNELEKITARSGLSHTHTLSCRTPQRRNVITYCKLQFADHADRDELITDNGPQLTSGSFW